MTAVPLMPATGLDLRPGAMDIKGAFVRAENLIVTPSGGLVRRPALHWRLRLPSTTAGLYAVGNQVRALAKHETTAAGLSPTIVLDYCESDVTGADILGQMVGSDGASLVLVKMPAGASELHHCPPAGDDTGDSTKITFSGTPDYALIGLESRAWALDAGLTKLWYSALDDADPSKLETWGPGGGDATNEEGFESLGQYAAGAGMPRALADFGGRLAVFFEAGMQVWKMDTDNTRYVKESTVAGVGCRFPRAIASIVGDVLLLTNAGIRSLTTVTQTLDPAEDAVGSKVDSLVNELANDTGANPIAIYARRLGCFLLAFGRDMVCLSLTPGQKVHGFSTWRLPLPVHAMCESAGKVWIRSTDDVFSLEDDDADDIDNIGGQADIPVRWETLGRRYPNGVMISGVSITATEDVRLQVVVDGRPSLAEDGGIMGSALSLPGRAPRPTWRSLGKMGRTVAVRGHDLATAAGYRIDDLALDINALGRSA